MDIIDTVTRQNLIDDQVLTKVPEKLLKEVGIVLPTCITNGIHALIKDKPQHESEEARLYDVLYMFTMASKGKIPSETIQLSPGEEMKYKLTLNDSSSASTNKEITIKAIVGPGDNLEPVLTFMLPCED